MKVSGEYCISQGEILHLRHVYVYVSNLRNLPHVASRCVAGSAVSQHNIILNGNVTVLNAPAYRSRDLVRASTSPSPGSRPSFRPFISFIGSTGTVEQVR